MASAAKKSKLKMNWQEKAAEGLRYLFFIIFAAVLLGIVLGARAISSFQEQEERRREKRVEEVIHERKMMPSPEPSPSLVPDPLPAPDVQVIEPLTPEQDRAPV